MTRSIERRRPFPYRADTLPLPDLDGNEERAKVVGELEILWLLLRKEPNLGRDVQVVVINRYFNSLPEKVKEWLEFHQDPRTRHSAAIMVKLHAIQLYQREDFSLLNGNQHEEQVRKFSQWITEAQNHEKVE